MSTLVAYSASAGSGKTFRITREYLKQILRKPNALAGYRNILAVTFTNKATEEMKARIVTELNELAQGDEKKLHDLCAEFAAENVAISPQDLQQRALNVRGSLLHDYSRFAILTIDKFFQKVLHAFVSDVGLHPNFNLELDSSRILDEAVDAVMENVEGNELLRAWLMQLQEQRLDGGKSWNVRDNLYELGQEIFKEEFGRLSAELQEKLYSKEFLQQYVQTLTGIKKEVDDEMLAISQKAKKFLQENGLSEDDFPYKSSGFIAHFRKISQGEYEPKARAIAAVNVIEKWSSKSSRTAKMDEAYNALNPLLARACQLWRDKSVGYQTADVILKNIMELGLLADIAQQVRSIASEENLLLISDTTALISQLVGDSDVPFIYEKVGNAYRTYMIDEFQDTSVGQWRNFLPLVSSSLSENALSMVVGDVKQSIYRWRSGDWRILAQGIDEDLKQFGTVNRRVLKDNWRSLRNVVEFNNELFTRMAEALQHELNAEMSEEISPQVRQSLERIVLGAYADCCQTPQSKSAQKGYIRMEFVEGSEEQKPADITLQRLPQLISDLQSKGYSMSDIAVLTRNNREAGRVAQTLVSNGIDVVSQDSLYIASSSVVKLCIALMRIAAGQKNEINEAFLRHELAEYITSAIPLKNHVIASNAKQSQPNSEEIASSSSLVLAMTEQAYSEGSSSLFLSTNKNLHTLFSSTLSADESEFLSTLTLRSLPEAFEAIVQRYELHRLQTELPFLQALHELVINFSNKKLSDLPAFLSWWDKSGSKKPLQSPAAQNAVSICTIHKSKGLEYRVVLLPFADWDLDTKTGSTVWFRPTQEPFRAMPSVPLAYTKKLRETIFAEQQQVEKSQAFVDNLNLLYVACTRAKEQLYIFSALKKGSQSGNGTPNVGQIMYGLFSNFQGEDNLSFGALTGKKESDTVYTFGEAVPALAQKEESSAGSIPLDFYPSQSSTPKLRMRYEAQELFTEGAPTHRSSGTLKHKIFERIATAADVPNAVNQLLLEGFIKSKDEAAALQREVAQAVAQPQAADWFDGSWQVHAEAEILLPSTQHETHHFFRRPDRVMLRDNRVVVVDYKFGDKVEPAHARQVADYMQHLRSMGYTQVLGYVWYVTLGEVQEVAGNE